MTRRLERAAFRSLLGLAIASQLGLALIGPDAVDIQLESDPRDDAAHEAWVLEQQIRNWMVLTAKGCPNSVFDVVRGFEQMAFDPWKIRFRSDCAFVRDQTGREHLRLAVWSAGPDRVDGTGDDVRSRGWWE